MRRIFCLPLILGASVVLSAANEKPVVTIGLVDTFSPAFYIKTYSPTLDHLIEALPEYDFNIVELDYQDVPKSIEKLKPDFILSSASIYLSLLETYGSHQIATKDPKNSPDVSHTVASAFIVNAGSPIKTLKQAKGKNVAVSDKDSFDGWLIAQGEIARQGENPQTFFSKIVETGYEVPDVASLVKTGRVEVGVLGTCEYEELVATGRIQPEEVRILDPKPKEGMCVRSTDRYPDVVFSYLPSVSSNIARKISVALMTMPTENLDFQWTVANDFRPAIELLKELGLGPFQKAKPWSFERVWKDYKTEILLALGFLAAVLFHIITLNIQVRKRTEDLRLSIEETKTFYRRAEESRQKLTSLERGQIVSQLSGMFAHEIKQPITNIGYYIGALKLLLAKEKNLSEKAQKIFDNLKGEIRRSSDIVEHVRGYAKKRPKTCRKSDLNEILEKVVEGFSSPSLNFQFHPDAWVYVDPFEIEFVLSNFIKNALEATKGIPNAQIQVRIEDRGEYWAVTVCDNGPVISDEQFKSLGRVLKSDKEEGLGFGLAISRAIAETNAGHLEFKQMKSGGLSVSLVLTKYICDDSSNPIFAGAARQTD